MQVNCPVVDRGWLRAEVSPPRTKPLVAMAEVDRPVMVVTTVAIRIMAMVSPISSEERKKGLKQSTFSVAITYNNVITGIIIIPNILLKSEGQRYDTRKMTHTHRRYFSKLSEKSVLSCKLIKGAGNGQFVRV